MHCGNCGANMNEDEIFCSKCGTKKEVVEQQNEMNNAAISFCPGCGNKLSQGESFCAKCGKKVEAVANTKAKETKEEVVPTEEKEEVVASEEEVQEEVTSVETKKENKTFCPNCGQDVDDSLAFCANCGNSLNATIKPVEVKAKVKKERKPIPKKVKVLIVSVLLLLVLAGTGVFLYFKLHDFTKLSWNEKKSDLDLTTITPCTLNFRADAYDKDGNRIKKIKYTVSNGKIVTEDGIVKWDLPNEAGKYTITAKAPSGKKITHEVTVVNISNKKKELNKVKEIKIEDDGDEDNDGLTNKEEKELKTNIYMADTDQDGLSDSYEVNVSKTNPLKADSDEDGLTDGNEVMLDLDPLNADSKGDGKKDSERTLSYELNNDDIGVSLTITGTGEIGFTDVSKIENKTFANSDGILSNVYNFSTKGKMNNAVVKIKYTDEELTENNIDEDNLKLYYFNTSNNELEEVETEVDKENNIVTVTLKHFSPYVLADSTVVNTSQSTEILFVIDNSVSMYTKEQMTEGGYPNATGAVGNDKEYKRIDLTNEMIDKFTGNYTYGVSEFSGNYVNLLEFTDKKKNVKAKVSSMKAKWESNLSGTAIINALESGINEFKTDDKNHYLMLLTDGNNTSGSLSYSKNSIIQKAKEKNVRVCVIGLGDVDASELNEIAEKTGCGFYNAPNADSLEEIYILITSDMNYNIKNINGDNAMLIADSGFVQSVDGFNFANYPSKETNEISYGMSAFAMLYYIDELPIKMGNQKVSSKDKSNGYDLTNTYFSNGKTLYDYNFETEEMAIYFGQTKKNIYSSIKDKVFKIDSKIKDRYKNYGFIIKEEDNKTKNYNKIEMPLLCSECDDIKNATSDEYQLLKAIYRLYLSQEIFETNSSSDETINRIVNDEKFNELIRTLNDGVPMVVGGLFFDKKYDNLSGSNIMNAVRMYQSLKNPDTFYLEIYDNNWPGVARYIEIHRIKNYTYINNVLEYGYSYEYKYQPFDGEVYSIILENQDPRTASQFDSSSRSIGSK